jgi:chaperone LolA
MWVSICTFLILASISPLSLAVLGASPTPLQDNINSPAAHQLRSISLAIASNPTDLDALIDGLQRKYSRMQGIAADFTQTYQGPDGRFLKESGHVLLKRPRKARWDYAMPERKVFLSDGRDIYFYVYGEREATKAPIKESVDPQIPFLFLLGQGNLRRDFSRIEPVPDVQPAAPGDTVLKLVPKRAPEEFKELLAEVNPVSFEVRRLVIFGRNGSRMDFLLTNVRENYVAPDSEFTFTPPTGVILRKAG